MTKTILTGVLIEEETYTFVEVCEKYELTKQMLEELMEYGLFQLRTKNIQQESFDSKILSRIQSARRLQNDLGINIPGVVLALELIDELEVLKKELQILKKHIER